MELAKQRKEVGEDKVCLYLQTVLFCFVFSKPVSSQSPEALALLAIQLPLLTLLGEVLFETMLNHLLCSRVTLRSSAVRGKFSLRREWEEGK